MFVTKQYNNSPKSKKAVLLYTALMMLAGLLLLSYPSKPASAAGTIWNCNDFPAFKAAVEAGGQVTVNCTDTIKAWMPMEITQDTTIVGANWAHLSGQNATRLFNVHSGKSLTLKQVIVQDGRDSTEGGVIFAANASINLESSYLETSSAGKGGAISMYGGKLTLKHSGIEGNIATSGGGIYNKAGKVEFNDSHAGGNHAQDGGLLYNDGGSFKFNGGMYIQNQADRFGGAIFIADNAKETLNTINNATFTENKAYTGGVLHVLSANWSGNVLVKNSTFNKNTASYGGVFANEVHLQKIEVANSTLANNTATKAGGAFVTWDGLLELDNVTVASNQAPTGGNIYTAAKGELYLRNSIVANGIGGNCAGNVANMISSHDLQFPGSSCGGNVTVANPKLGPLANNGGSTETMVLISGSPAINAGDNNICALSTIANKDQRGMPRPAFGQKCDIGAFEYQGFIGGPRK